MQACFLNRLVGAVQMIAAFGGRKVRAPQDRALDNDQRGRPQGKCHREKSARFDG